MPNPLEPRWKPLWLASAPAAVLLLAAALAAQTEAATRATGPAACPSWLTAAEAPPAKPHKPQTTTTTTVTTTTTATTTAATTTTAAPVSSAAPMIRVATSPAVEIVPGSTMVGASRAVLVAAVTTHGGPALVTAQYSRGKADSVCTRVQEAAKPRVQIVLSQLRPGTRYRFRVAVKNAAGTTVGGTGTFVTLPAGRIAQGVTVGTMRVGRFTRAAALAALSRPAAAPISLTYAGAYWHVAPSKLGLRVGAKSALARAAQAAPGTQLPSPSISVDRSQLRIYVAALARRWSRKPQAAGVKLVGRHAVVTRARAGIAIDSTRLTAELDKQLETGTRARITLPTTVNRTVTGPPQKAVVVRLGSQTLTAYLNGKPILKTPVTTGRPALPTPIGSFSVQFRASPYVFNSPWPPGSPYYYPPTPVTWAMEFYDGDFLHDDPAEPASDFGSDSQNGYFASHGCVHVPHDQMAFLFNWLPVGAPVIVAES
jgi:lipoprotein-anchoring transpeptidase ErfK/SrfK